MVCSLRQHLVWCVAPVLACGSGGAPDGSATTSTTVTSTADTSTGSQGSGQPTSSSSVDADASANATSSEVSGAPTETGSSSSGAGSEPDTGTSTGMSTGTSTGTGTGTGTGTSTGTGTGTGTGTDTDTGTGTGTDTDTDTDTGFSLCKANEEPDAPPKCKEFAPPSSFDAEIQWTFTPLDGRVYSQTTPLVANLTDDNGDGAIDLCDTPDVVLLGFGTSQPFLGRLYVLDGATGALHFSIGPDVHWRHTPALGDIDGDGLIEIVAQAATGDRIVAFEHDGTVKWESEKFLAKEASSGPAVALADVDNDGDVEIIFSDALLDHEGNLLWLSGATNFASPATAAADLDGDGDLEIIYPSGAYHHDASVYYTSPIPTGFPQIADFDGDGEPEVLITSTTGLAMLEHDGQIKFKGLTPVGGIAFDYFRPAAVHDFDGDLISEFAVSSANKYTVYEGDATIVWSAAISDKTGAAGGTAFDFLGDGVAEAIYGDEKFMFIFDGQGIPLVKEPRSSATITEYPVVADVDNDGSAEILVVSSPFILFQNLPNPYPTLQVIRDKEDRWVQARRIWNQHTYHVTNIREDGTVPQFEPPSWKQLNTYRTNAQLDNGTVCSPVPQ